VVNVALIAGATGIVGRRLAAHLLERGWRVLGLSRGGEAIGEPIRLDLADAAACRAAASRLAEVTHVFYAGRAPRPDAAEEAAVNRAMLANLLAAVEPAAPGLRHVALVHGTKWYGSHLGPFRTPAKEDDPRTIAPNFYYDQQDDVAALQRGKGWTWSALRPHFVCGVSAGYPHNILGCIAVYASICKALGLPLRFPGAPGRFDALTMFTDAGLLARALEWAATTPGCANQAFNLHNGDFARWRDLWPKLAELFELRPGPVQRLPLARFMADKEPLWAGLVARHGLQPRRIAELASWPYADGLWANEWDEMSSMTKARRFGFHDGLDSEQAILESLAEYRRLKLVP
jgi:nucleoside-diphosphate-sugar epimerase